MELQGKTAVISGGAEGIGFAMAQAVGRLGMNVVLADINAAQLASAEKALTEQDIKVLAVPLDAADIKQWARMADLAVERFGKIHMLLNNAGVAGTPGSVAATDPGDWRWVVDVNLLGVVNGAQTLIPLMQQHGEESWVINVASMAGLGGLPLAGAYSATKAAVVAVSECWHSELNGSAIHVSVLCPGFVKTRINESTRNKQSHYHGETSVEPDSAVDPAMKEYMQSVIDAGLAPERVAERVLEAMAAHELYVFTHPNYWPVVQKRFAAIEAAFERAAASPLLRDVLDEPVPGFG